MRLVVSFLDGDGSSCGILKCVSKEFSRIICGFDCRGIRIGAICRFGDLKLFAWMMNHKNCPKDKTTELISGNTGCVKMMIEAREKWKCPWSFWTARNAGYHGHLDLVIYLHYNQCPRMEDVCGTAARKGHTHVLKWVKDNTSHWSLYLTDNAASGGHFETLLWLDKNASNDVIFGPSTLSTAAEHGHLEIVKWLVTVKKIHIHKSCHFAASGGHIEVLQWLKEKGCCWDHHILRSAACRGRNEVIRWGLENGLENSKNQNRICEAAITGRQLNTLKLLRELGFTWRKSWCLHLAYKGRNTTEIIEWIESQAD